MLVPFAQLRNAAPEGSLIRPATHRIALLTGQSDPTNTALTPAQQTFLRAVAPIGFDILAHGFPYHAACETPGRPQPNLLRASLNNVRQTAASILSPSFRALIATRLNELLTQTGRTLILITGSCGLQFLNDAWLLLQRTTHTRIIALGPACLRPHILPAAQLTTIRGTHDTWSRLLYRHPIDHTVPGGHLDYWTSPDTIALTRALLAATTEPAPQ